MHQSITGHDVYVVEFDTLPELPITFANEDEQPYALALAQAIQTGTITEPGKYGIEIHSEPDADELTFQIYAIVEP